MSGLVILLLGLCYHSVTAAMFPFQDTTISWEKRVDDLVSRLTLEEIANQTIDQMSNAVPRLGIKQYIWCTECLRGEKRANTTAFPQSIGLAGAFSPELIYNMSEALGKEVRGHWNSYQKAGIQQDMFGLSCYSPVLNIARHPLWGRNQETYGECPHLSGRLAFSFVQGLQGSHPRYVQAAAGCKHFDVHGGPEDLPSSRYYFNSQVSRRDWRMTFLPAFKKCVEAGTYSLMCSYNSINGVPACANKELLTSILREEWQFKGFVISDEGAIGYIKSGHNYTHSDMDTLVAAMTAGCNMDDCCSPDEKPAVYLRQVEAVQRGILSDAQVRDNVKPQFMMRMKLGEFDPPSMNPYASINMSVVQSANHRALALTAAQMTFTLLKNKDKVLPLTGKANKLALVGPFSNTSGYELFGDYSSNITPVFTTNVWEGLRHVAGETRVASGCNDTVCQVYDQSSVMAAVQGSDLVIVTLGTGLIVEQESFDRINLDLPGRQLDLLKDAVYYAKGAHVIVLLFNAGPVDVTWAELSPHVHAIMECYFPAQTAGVALYNTLTAANAESIPAGRLPVTWPAFIGQVPPMTNYTMIGRTYRYYLGNPLYPFGYGLSYTHFLYSELTITPRIVTTNTRSLKVSVKVRNTGQYDADEVTQAYVSWPRKYWYIMTPKIQLVGFKRSRLLHNQEMIITMEIDTEDLAVWVDDDRKWQLLPGTMTLYVGGQQPDQRTQLDSNILNSTFVVTGA